ncbi:AAA family ATPase [Myroides sp. WP-1]|nr:AAA family ATPase [Myroides sp. WP-1]
MHKIKIKNFGPIKEGFLDKEGWMDINKVTVFIGNQGSGKSTVAKLIATFMWLEKALIRGDIDAHVMTFSNFIELLRFHRIENYFSPSTTLEYIGAVYTIHCTNEIILINKHHHTFVEQPKIMYVPAERNFLSAIPNINKVSNLIIGSLQYYAVEYRNAQLTQEGKPLLLPINNTQVIYDPTIDETFIEFNEGKRLKLTEASSGFHSLVPLVWVTQYLLNFLKQGDENLLKLLSPDHTIRRNKELNTLSLGIALDNYDEKVIREKEKQINGKYIAKHLINIVEEPEQNLFPSSQRLLLNQLLAYNSGNNQLIMTTHSPYLVNYLTLAIEANKLKEKMLDSSVELRNRLYDIVPLDATLAADDLIIYQLDETTGTITKLKTYNGLPSDENYLNDGLAETNELFSKLLALEDELCL